MLFTKADITNIRGGEPITGRAVLAEICSSQLQSFLPAANLLPRWELWGCLTLGQWLSSLRAIFISVVIIYYSQRHVKSLEEQK